MTEKKRKYWSKECYLAIRKQYIKEAEKVFQMASYTLLPDVIGAVDKLVNGDNLIAPLKDFYRRCGGDSGMVQYEAFKRQLKAMKADISGSDIATELSIETEMIKYYYSNVASKVVTVESSFVGALKRILNNAIAQNLHVTQSFSSLVPMLQKQWGAQSSWMALRIAVTETTSVMNYGQRLGVAQFSQYEKEKQWLVGGRNIRDSHYAAANQGFIAFDAEYDVGGEKAMYPGDPSLSASNICNCKCTEIYRIKE